MSFVWPQDRPGHCARRLRSGTRSVGEAERTNDIGVFSGTNPSPDHVDVGHRGSTFTQCIPPRRDVSKLAGPQKFVLLASRRPSRCTRAQASLPNALARLIVGIVAAALAFAVAPSGRLQRASWGDALHSVSPLAALPTLHSVPSHRPALESRSPARSASGFNAALPAFAPASGVADAVHRGRLVASAFARASIDARGYDATAPPALS